VVVVRGADVARKGDQDRPTMKMSLLMKGEHGADLTKK
jgi:hypothetical protein